MSEDKKNEVGRAKRMEPSKIEGEPNRPMLSSWKRRAEANAAAGAAAAYNKYAGEVVKHEQLKGDLVDAQGRLLRKKAERDNMDRIVEADRAQTEVEIEEARLAKDVAIAKADEVVGDSNARRARSDAKKAQADAAREKAEADALEQKIRKAKLEAKLKSIGQDAGDDELEALLSRKIELEDEIDDLKKQIEAILMETGDKAQSKRNRLNSLLRAAEGQLAVVKIDIKAIQDDAG